LRILECEAGIDQLKRLKLTVQSSKLEAEGIGKTPWHSARSPENGRPLRQAQSKWSDRQTIIHQPSASIRHQASCIL